MCIASEPRPLMEQVYHELSREVDAVVAIAPTSYGKTASSPWMWKQGLEDGVAGGLIHVAPLRSLIRRAYEDFFRPCGARLQAHGIEPEIKSPYFLAPLVVSTLDSFLWNLYRIPVAEALKVVQGKSMGHYYPALAAILSSLIVFDEAHMYLWEEGAGHAALETSLAATAALAKAGVPVIIETATLRSKALEVLATRLGGRATLSVKVLKAPARANACPYIDRLHDDLGHRRVKVAEVVDPVWEDEKLVSWKTVIAEDWNSVINLIADDASTGPVLVITNMVSEALYLYAMLRERVGRIVLLHGRLSEDDRREGEKYVKTVERKGGVIVSTQVAEAGVDVNSLAVYTAVAPLENLAQRAGRACRRDEVLEACSIGEGGRIVIVANASLGPYSRAEASKTLKAVRSVVEGGKLIDWRATCNHGSYVSYATLLSITSTGGRPDLLFTDLLEDYLRGDAQPWVLLEQLDRRGLCNLARGSAMVEVEAGKSVVTASLEWVLEQADHVLEMGKEGPALVVEDMEGNRYVIEARRLWRVWLRSRRFSKGRECMQLLGGLLRDIENAIGSTSIALYRFIAREDAYVEGLGLLTNRERKVIEA